MQPTILLNDLGRERDPLRPLAAGTDVRFVGEAVAMVIAENRYIAEDACDLVDLDLDQLPAVIDFETAAADTVNLVHPEKGTNIARRWRSFGSTRVGSRRRRRRARRHRTFYQHRQTNVPMETRYRRRLRRAERRAHAVDVDPEPARGAPIARVTDVAEDLVRVTGGDVGGGFGQKFFTLARSVRRLASCAAHRTGRQMDRGPA